MKTLCSSILVMLISLSAVFANDCVTGNAVAKNIQYKVNGKSVSSLKGNITQGSLVEISFTTQQGSKPTNFSLVSYMANSSTRSMENSEKLDIYDYDTQEFSEGVHKMEVFVPNGYFEVDFVKGCVITKFDTYENYEKQNRLIMADNGGLNTNPPTNKVTICHIPFGNIANAHTITIAEPAAKAHVNRHGDDYYGPCSNDTANVLNVYVGCDTVVASSSKIK